MAIIRQESSFKPNAAPDREKILGVIPWKRPSSAKGYAQAVNSTWEDYKKETGNSRASRSSFSSSVDFIGWYLSKAPSARIQPQEVDKLYLAYHEGYGGYKRETYKGKSWLIDTARKVKFNSLKYKRQLNSCPSTKKEVGGIYLIKIEKRFFFDLNSLASSSLLGISGNQKRKF